MWDRVQAKWDSDQDGLDGEKTNMYGFGAGERVVGGFGVVGQVRIKGRKRDFSLRAGR